MDKFKTISSIGLIGLVGLIAYLFWQNGQLKDNKANQIQEINQLHWMLSAKEAETDTIFVQAEYSVPESIIVTRIRYVETEGRIDTVLEDIPRISGNISIDTTVSFGLAPNLLTIRVEAELYYPEEFAYKNWLLFYPVSEKPPYLASKPRSTPKWGLGLSYTRSFSASNDGHRMDYMGISGRYQRFSLTSAYDPWSKTALMTVGFDILRF